MAANIQQENHHLFARTILSYQNISPEYNCILFFVLI